MMKVGYLNTELPSKRKILEEYGCNKIVVKSEENSDMESVDLFLKQFKNDELVVAEIYDFNMQLLQLNVFLKYIREQKIKLVVLNKIDTMTSEQYVDFLYQMSRKEKHVITERVRYGIEAAKNKGNIGGRPKIPEDLKEKILHLHKNQQLSYRKIAEQCNVSIGTVHKYIHEDKEQ